MCSSAKYSLGKSFTNILNEPGVPGAQIDALEKPEQDPLLSLHLWLCASDNTVKIWVLLASLFLEPTKSYIGLFTILLVWCETCLFLWDQSQLGLYWIVPGNGGKPCNFAIRKSPTRTASLGLALNPAVYFLHVLTKFLRRKWVHGNTMSCLRFLGQLDFHPPHLWMVSSSYMPSSLRHLRKACLWLLDPVLQCAENIAYDLKGVEMIP